MAKIIHIDIDPASISRNVKVDISIAADAKNIITALLDKTPEFDFTEWRLQIEKWKKDNPDKDVIAICGDGGIQMNIQEMATAVVYELPVIICILNNGYLGNVRKWREMFFQKHYSATCLRYRRSCPEACNSPSASCPEYTPDFIRLAKSYGAKAVRVQRYEEIEPALSEAKHTHKIPTVIEFMIEREENVFPIVPPGNAPGI